MLVGFSGPSAVGKTTIMRCLADLHEWKFVRVATTRPIRERESEKFQVSRDNYESMQANGKFWCSNTLFGNSYGTLKLDIEASASSDGIFMLDWPIAKIQSLQQVANLIFLIKPESEEQLVKQILASARSNRMDAIISDYRVNYSSSNISAILTEQEPPIILLENKRLDDESEIMNGICDRIVKEVTQIYKK